MLHETAAPAGGGGGQEARREREAHERTTLRTGAVCAVLGAVVSVAAGAGFADRTPTWDPVRLLTYLTAQPGWYWPTVHLGFILGALLWVGAFAAIADTLPGGLARTLGRLATASVTVGAAIHAVDSLVDGFGLAALARMWASAAGAEREGLLRDAVVLQQVLHGTWAGVAMLFHGLPFVLLGAAVVATRRVPAWFGGTGSVAGAVAFVAGVLMFLGLDLLPQAAFIDSAVAVSLWMVVLGVLLGRRAAVVVQ